MTHIKVEPWSITEKWESEEATEPSDLNPPAFTLENF